MDKYIDFQSEDDILLRDELETLADMHSSFKLWFTVDKAPEGKICENCGLIGYITLVAIVEILFLYRVV